MRNRAADPTYVEIDMPDWFVLELQDEAGNWTPHGRYLARDFARLPDGAYLCRPPDGSSPLWLRCLWQEGALIEVEAARGDTLECRLVPV